MRSRRESECPSQAEAYAAQSLSVSFVREEDPRKMFLINM